VAPSYCEAWAIRKLVRSFHCAANVATYGTPYASPRRLLVYEQPLHTLRKKPLFSLADSSMCFIVLFSLASLVIWLRIHRKVIVAPLLLKVYSRTAGIVLCPDLKLI
jgi:hypothetical protein